MAPKKTNGKASEATLNIARQRVAIYCRVSSEEQADAHTIKNQVDYANKYVELNGLAVHDFYLDDAVTGTLPLHEREQGRRLLEDAKAGKFGVVLVYRVDRLARRLKVLLDSYEALQDAEADLKSMTEPIDSTTPIGRFIFQLLGSIAELERETIIERTFSGRRRIVQGGQFPGGQPPLGYRVEGEKRNRRIVIDEDEAATVREMFRLYAEENMGLIQLGRYLDDHGIKPTYMRRGKGQQGNGRWTFGTVAQVLRNSAYKGVYQWGKRGRTGQETVEVPCPPIVSEALWSEVQAKMQRNLTFSKRNAKREYLLRGLVICGSCGHAFVGDGNHKRQQFHYHCSHDLKRYEPNRCHNVTLGAELLEKLIWQGIVEFSENPGRPLLCLREKLQERLGRRHVVEEELAKLEGDLTRKQRERDRIIGLLRRELITDSEGERQLSDLAPMRFT